MIEGSSGVLVNPNSQKPLLTLGTVPARRGLLLPQGVGDDPKAWKSRVWGLGFRV